MSKSWYTLSQFIILSFAALLTSRSELGWKGSRESRARIFDLLQRIASARYWLTLGCSLNDRNGQSCLDAAQHYEDLFSQPSQCPAALSPGASDVMPLIEFPAKTVGEVNGQLGTTCADSCQVGLGSWADKWGCCASMAAHAQEEWWRAFGAFSDAEQNNSSVTFSVMAEYGYERTYRIPQVCTPNEPCKRAL